MTIRHTTIWLLLTLALIAPPAQSQTTSMDSWFRMSPRRGDFRASAPWKLFNIELPEDWQLVPGYNSTLLIATEKRGNQPGGAIVIEHTLNIQPLGPENINPRLATNEADYAKQRDTGGKDFQQEIKDVNNQRFMLIQYSRGGLIATDRVALYVFPAGKTMYRLICIAPEKEMVPKYQQIFAHVAWSFKPVISTAN